MKLKPGLNRYQLIWLIPTFQKFVDNDRKYRAWAEKRGRMEANKKGDTCS